jgi:hypothetical protein
MEEPFRSEYVVGQKPEELFEEALKYTLSMKSLRTLLSLQVAAVHMSQSDCALGLVSFRDSQ